MWRVRSGAARAGDDCSGSVQYGRRTATRWAGLGWAGVASVLVKLHAETAVTFMGGRRATRGRHGGAPCAIHLLRGQAMPRAGDGDGDGFARGAAGGLALASPRLASPYHCCYGRHNDYARLAYMCSQRRAVLYDTILAAHRSSFGARRAGVRVVDSSAARTTRGAPPVGTWHGRGRGKAMAAVAAQPTGAWAWAVAWACLVRSLANPLHGCLLCLCPGVQMGTSARGLPASLQTALRRAVLCWWCWLPFVSTGHAKHQRRLSSCTTAATNPTTGALDYTALRYGAEACR